MPLELKETHHIPSSAKNYKYSITNFRIIQDSFFFFLVAVIPE